MDPVETTDALTDKEKIRLLEAEIDRLERYSQQLKKAVRRCFYTIQMLEVVRDIK